MLRSRKINEGANGQDFTVCSSDNNLLNIENIVNVKTLERCFTEKIDREMSNIVDTVEDRIQNAVLIAIDNIVAPKIELAIRSINASSGRDATSVTANSEHGEHIAITAPFENASENNNVLHKLNVNDETRNNIPDEVSELSVPGTHFDRQTDITAKQFAKQLLQKTSVKYMIDWKRGVSPGKATPHEWRLSILKNIFAAKVPQTSCSIFELLT